MASNTVQSFPENSESQIDWNSDSSSEDESANEIDPSVLPPSLYVQGNINVYMQVNSATQITTLSNNAVQVHQPEVDYNVIFQDLRQFWKQRANSRRRNQISRKWNDMEYETASFYIKLEMKDQFSKCDFPIELEKLFETYTFGDRENEVGEKIFIQGNPGFGKTTLSHKIYEDWGQDLEYVKQFQLAIFIQLRHLSKENFREYFKQALIPQEKRDQSDKYWEALAEFQEKTLFILDGYDEVPKSLKGEIDQLMTGSLFGRSTVLLTSRFLPSNVELIACSTKNVTIMGFASEQIIEFASRILSQPLAEKFRETITDSDVYQELAQCPLSCNMLCQLFEIEEGNIPSNYTQLYTNMVKLQMRRAKFRNKRQSATSDKESSEDDSSDEESGPNAVFGPYDALLQQLGKLAWDCLLKTRFVLKRKQLRTALGEDYRQVVDLTVLYKEHELDSQAERSTATYAFAHRTFQEFFAAFYLAKHVTSSQELALCVRELMDCHMDSYFMLLSFMVGLLGPKAGLLFQVYRTSRIDDYVAYQFYKEIPENSSLLRELASQLHYTLDCRANNRSCLHSLVLSETSAVKDLLFTSNPSDFGENWSLQAFLGRDFSSLVQVTAITVSNDSHSNLGQLRLQPRSKKLDLLNLKLCLRNMQEPPLDVVYDKTLCRMFELLNRHTRLRRLAGITLWDTAPDDKELFKESLATFCSLHDTLESLELHFEGTWEYKSDMWDFVVSALTRSSSLKEISVIDGISFGGLEKIKTFDLPREALFSALVELSRTTNLRRLSWKEQRKDYTELHVDVLADRNWGNLTHLTLKSPQEPFDGRYFFESLADTKLVYLALKQWHIHLYEEGLGDVLDSLKRSKLGELRFVRCTFEITYPTIESGNFQLPPEGSVLTKLTHLSLKETHFHIWPTHFRDVLQVVSEPRDASLRILSYFRSQLQFLRLDGTALMSVDRSVEMWFDFLHSLSYYDQLTSLHIDFEHASDASQIDEDLYLQFYGITAYEMPAVMSEKVSEALSHTKIVDVRLDEKSISAPQEKRRLVALIEGILRGRPYLQRLGIPPVNGVELSKNIADLLRDLWKGNEIRLDLSRGILGTQYNFVHALVHDLQYGNEDDKLNFEVKYLGVSTITDSSFLVQRKGQSAYAN